MGDHKKLEDYGPATSAIIKPEKKWGTRWLAYKLSDGWRIFPSDSGAIELGVQDGDALFTIGNDLSVRYAPEEGANREIIAEVRHWLRAISPKKQAKEEITEMAEKVQGVKDNKYVKYADLCPGCKEKAKKKGKVPTTTLCKDCKKIYYNNAAKGKTGVKPAGKKPRKYTKHTEGNPRGRKKADNTGLAGQVYDLVNEIDVLDAKAAEYKELADQKREGLAEIKRAIAAAGV